VDSTQNLAPTRDHTAMGNAVSETNEARCENNMTTCKRKIHEADFMTAITKVAIRKQVKTPTLGRLAKEFSDGTNVSETKEEHPTQQARKSTEGMQAAAEMRSTLSLCGTAAGERHCLQK
jgi:hypothetical protein